MKNWCFSKKLLAADYAIMILCITLIVIFAVLEIDATYISAFSALWAVQLGVSSGFYYTKAKTENKIKLSLQLIASLIKEIPEDMRGQMDLNTLIPAVFDIND